MLALLDSLRPHSFILILRPHSSLHPHSFIASQQASFYTKCKTSLQPGEFLVSMDFSENYASILQDAA